MLLTRCLKTSRVSLGSSRGKIFSRDLREGLSRKVVCQIGQQKCLYTKASSIRNKKEKLEIIMYLENYDLVAIMETWWNYSQNQNTTVEGYQLFRRERLGRKGGGVALYS